ncbi:amidohydrolase family protein [Mycolicibacterium arseniciresistens]|uniref:Amidohydrolase family protein n=1 Tax=Mycolicibacterium arseniciresistens TaxID=3062257 RepID=A0ABT8UJ54_9MYCO|nr:amidohydrolase family protein [Mycolicibacterium arseniciresistens]MDO3637820.1 amidohydrolase family protein [Mycolicibacterium arseniciresistens]
MLITRALLLDGTPADIRVGEQILEVAQGLTARPGETVLDAAGGTVIPGLHDHHVHLHSTAAAAHSLRVGPADVRGRDGLAHALAGAETDADGWIRAVGYHEAVAGPLDRDALDAVSPPAPVRVQHRSGVVWTLNTAALRRVGMADHPDGVLRSADPSWAPERRDTELADVSRRLTSWGVTGITDATPDLTEADIAGLRDAHRRGDLAVRVHVLAPGKRILHDDGLDLDELTRWIAGRHLRDTAVAVHCVTAAQIVVTIAALRAAGTRAGDRIEHAAVVPDDCLTDLAELGLTVVTQPNFVAERGDQYLLDVPADELPQLWRLRSLLESRVKVALSTDSPFGCGDPWAAMRAAVRRETPAGDVLGPDERVSAATALNLFFGAAEEPSRPRRVAPGQPGDLCVLAASPTEVLDALDADLVAATIVGGDVVYPRQLSRRPFDAR